MAQVDSENSIAVPAASTRGRFLSQAAGVAASGAALTLATVECAAAPMAAVGPPSADPIVALIARHRAEEQAYGDALGDALKVRDALHEIVPAGRIGRVQGGMRAPDRPNYLHSHKAIDDCLVAGSREAPKIKARLHAELDCNRIELAAKREEIGLPAALDRVEQLCDSCGELEWALATTMPTSIAGVAAVMRYANECEDQGEEWPVA